MREIKFRAWDGKNKEMTYLDNLWICYEYSSLCFGYEDSGICEWGKKDVEDYEIMQYTGLKDKNGKEIYEGDIIQFKANYTSKPCGYINGIIQWNDNGARFEFKAFNISEPYDLVEESDEGSYMWTVLGNIHENPKLANL